MMDARTFFRENSGRMSDEAMRRALGLKHSAFLYLKGICGAANKPAVIETPQPQDRKRGPNKTVPPLKVVDAFGNHYGAPVGNLKRLRDPFDLSARDLLCWLLHKHCELDFESVGKWVGVPTYKASAGFKRYDASISFGEEPNPHRTWRKAIQKMVKG